MQDDGTRVERLRSTATANGDNDGEYWKVTTPDGMAVLLRQQPPHRLDRRQAGDELGVIRCRSSATTPGEPCYSATYAAAWCQQAYRWRLDYVVDPHGNTMSYWYAREPNNYARNLSAGRPRTYGRAT